jgi:hypothetical protein
VLKLTIDVAETASFALFGVVKTSSPINRNVALLSVQSRGTLHTSSSTDTAKLKKAVKNGTIISNIVFALLSHEAIHVVRRDLLEEIDVVVRVKLCHFTSSGGFCALRSRQEAQGKAFAIRISQGRSKYSRKSPSSGRGCTA